MRRILGWRPPHLLRPLRRQRQQELKVDIRTRDGYNIACALRGPDIDGLLGGILKRTFAERIRFLAEAAVAALPDRILVRTARLSPDEADALRKAVTWCAKNYELYGGDHYLVHCEYAAHALDDKQLAELAKRLRQVLVKKEPMPNQHQIIALAGGGDG